MPLPPNRNYAERRVETVPSGTEGRETILRPPYGINKSILVASVTVTASTKVFWLPP